MIGSETWPAEWEARSGQAKKLSKREAEVAYHLAMGKSCKQIGALLGISTKTCDTHRGHILEKLDLDNAAQLARWAIAEGLTSSPLEV